MRDASADIKGKRFVMISTHMNDKKWNESLKDTVHVPTLRANLLSVGKICDRGFRVLFDHNGATIVNAADKPIIRAERDRNGLYLLRAFKEESDANVANCREVKQTPTPTMEWYCKMIHLHFRDLVRRTRQ